jgi:tyrocidine synthetase-3
VEEQSSYALSHAQRRLWVLDQRQQDALPFNGLEVFRLEGLLDLEVLGSAFDSLIDRHESLRTVFELVDGEPRQRILSREESGFRVDHTDLRSGALDGANRGVEETQMKAANIEGQQEVAVARLVEQEARIPFDLQTGPMFRVRVVQLADHRWLILFASHHIISDEWSMQVLVKELLSLYNAYKKGAPNPLAPLPIQYKDYAAWQLAELRNEHVNHHRQYWLRQFAGELPVLDLPSDRTRPSIQTFKGDHVPIVLPEEGSEKLLSLCRDRGITLFMGLLALVKVLLYRYSGQEDLIVGTPVAGRDHPDLEGQIGYYLNTLALRTKVDGQSGFGKLLEAVKQTTLDAFSHQAYPFDLLIEDLKVIPDASRSPLFDVVVILQNIRLNESSDLLMDGVVVENLGADLRVSKGDLRFQFIEEGSRIEGNIEYNTDLYDRSRIEKMGWHLGSLLSAIVNDVDGPIRNLRYISEDESLQIVNKASHFASKLSEDY